MLPKQCQAAPRPKDLGHRVEVRLWSLHPRSRRLLGVEHIHHGRSVHQVGQEGVVEELFRCLRWANKPAEGPVGRTANIQSIHSKQVGSRNKEDEDLRTKGFSLVVRDGVGSSLWARAIEHPTEAAGDPMTPEFGVFDRSP